jgi:hypothetical protein
MKQIEGLKNKQKIKIGPKLIAILTIALSLSACRKSEEQKWVPNFWSGDAENGRIIKDNGDGTIRQISCIEEDFNEYHCLHIDKINELRRIIRKRCK